MPIYALGEHEPRIDPTAFVHPDAVVIGDVTIGARSSIWPCAVLRGDEGGITVGEETSIQDGSVIHTTPHLPTRVGNRCTVGHLVHLEGCRILDGALVGNGSIVLHDAEVQEGAIVGSNAVVPGGMVVPPRRMALGIPAKVRDGHEVDPAMTEMPAQHYVERAATYNATLRRIG